jgi:hypothetical protein
MFCVTSYMYELSKGTNAWYFVVELSGTVCVQSYMYECSKGTNAWYFVVELPGTVSDLRVTFVQLSRNPKYT